MPRFDRQGLTEDCDIADREEGRVGMRRGENHMNKWDKDDILEASIAQAEAWQNHANTLLTAEEKGIQEQMHRLLSNPMDKVILTKLIDQSFRSDDPSRVADQIDSLLQRYGVPDFFSRVEKLLMQMFLGLGKHFPDIAVPRMIDKMRQSSSRAIIPGETGSLHTYLHKRREQDVRININHLGEAVLGEEEARFHLKTYLEDLRDPLVEYISIKISTIYSQIQPLAFDHTVNTVMDRLSLLYRTAGEQYFVRKDGSKIPKFVNLDMEEYRDLEITVNAFMRTLDRDEFKDHSAGLALQAYLPDSYGMQQEITAWAKKRVSDGGQPIKIRIVKGANMEMERIEAALNNWPLAPYDNKLDVDANFKRMVDFGMEPDHIEAVHLGVGSHNLFDLAYAYEIARHRNMMPFFTFEMLEGMADHVRRAIQETSGAVVLYAPVAAKEQFKNAIAYLIRRLDENTGEENFLRHAPNLSTSSNEWVFLKKQFLDSYEHRAKAGKTPKRNQNRFDETFPDKMGTFYERDFVNEPDTDWSRAPNRLWARDIRDKWQRESPAQKPIQVPLVVAGVEIFEKREIKELMDPSQTNEKPGRSVLIASCALGNGGDVAKAVEIAKADPEGWHRRQPEERHLILSKVAMEIRRARGDLIGAAAASTGKVFTESDPEVSEAVDYTEYYPYAATTFTELKNVEWSGKGVGVVISPWNFPIAIPCGGMVASLATGNRVILKPASSAILVAWVLCQCFWKAGISKNVLQFLPCTGAETGSKLTNHPEVDFVILTGGTDTGLSILRQRPDLFLAAETGGKNATIVTAISDRDQAIRNVVHSAFSNCGQKCSATSLLVLEREVYEDEKFKRQLIDAAKSFTAGMVWNFRNRMGPLIHPPEGPLKRALTRLEPGESWALKPENILDNPNIWTAGIKWGVQPGSYTHMTEFFGPVLGVMVADDLDHAIRIINQTGYGLTSGLESLDEREHEYWKARIKAGNLYINRVTTGAIVLRQPFGGMGKSAIGAGIKAGGPNYVAQFMDFKDITPPPIGTIEEDHALWRLAQEWQQKLTWGELAEFGDDLKKTVHAIRSYLFHIENDFSREKDYFHLRGQDNVVRYLPVIPVVVRLHPKDGLFDVLARIAAARISGCRPEVSLPAGVDNQVTAFLLGMEGKKLTGEAPVRFESDEDIIEKLPEIGRLRYGAPDRVPYDIYREAAKHGITISRTRVMMEGRIELIQYFREQSISNNYHRYGNLGGRL